jgi:hypothetical protein
MSIPAFGWALDQGARMKLRPSDRLLLLYLADQSSMTAQGEMLCRAGQERIVKFTGLAPNTVRAAAERLAKAQLIRVIAAVGMVTKYVILRGTPANGAGVTPAKRAGVTPSNGAGVAPQNVAHHPSTDCVEPPHGLRLTPANRAPVPSSSQDYSPKSRAPAREAGRFENSGKQEGAAPPTAPPRPQPDATDSGDPGDQPADPGQVAAVLAALKRELRMRAYPPRAAVLDRDEQIAAVEDKPRPKPAHLAGAALAAARARAGVGRIAA